MSIEDSFKSSMIALNDIQQYMRKQNLIFRKLDDVPMDKYDFDFVEYITDKLNDILPPMKFGQVTRDDINDAHPLYTDDKSTSSPAVIVQFSKVRNEILKNKKSLEERCGVRVTEHLTKHNRDMLNQARDIVGGYYAWTQKGVVYASIDDDTKIQIKTNDDLRKLRSHGCVPRSPPPKKKRVKNFTKPNSRPPLVTNKSSDSSQAYSHDNDVTSNSFLTTNNNNNSDFVYGLQYSGYRSNVRGRGRGTSFRGSNNYYQRGYRGRGGFN